jgi:hypothetical protein
VALIVSRTTKSSVPTIGRTIAALIYSTPFSENAMDVMIIILIGVFVTTNEAKRFGTPLASKFYRNWNGEQYDQTVCVRASRRHDGQDYIADGIGRLDANALNIKKHTSYLRGSR